jgi:superfamily I DNA/RNA helicase
VLQELLQELPPEVLSDAGSAPSGAPAPPHEIVIPGEEEERRLFYVAITRAKQELYLVFPVMARDRGGLDVLMEPSRFVRELPGELYEKWVIDA